MIIREKVRIGDQLVTLETGRIAKQAGGSCLVRAGDTLVLVTVCGMQDPKPGQSFFPLSVEYQEKTYAAGKIPGGFFKREGKLRDYEVLTSRLIDRPCRPLFPEGYLNEVQIVATVMSFDGENPPDTLAMIGASAALHISPIPWKGPIAGVRVGRVDGEWVANPTFKQLETSDCDFLIAASRDAIVMVEGEAEEISEDDMVEALMFGHRAVQATLDLIDRMQQAVGKTKWPVAVDKTPQILKDRVRQVGKAKVREACSIAIKHERSDRFKAIKKEVVEILQPEFPEQVEAIKAQYEDLKYNTMRAQVLEDGRRLDGRDTRTVRPISIELGVLPRVHGSSLFTRGETQAIVTTTLGTARDQQRIDTLRGDEHKRFMLHYNFPPYSVGEVKPMRGPGRREVGHGNLAERALAKMLPTMEEFPYSLRIVSEITESNGSSSMASVCGGALALMDAGVPLKAPVAGVAMGLIAEGDDYAILTDILGDEDALGDMDFKVCGTEAGITAIQMDIKVEGLSREILEQALRQAREGRIHILGKMNAAIRAPREELSRWAPRITQIRVKPDQIRTIIGPGGKMIRAIVDQTGASIDVEDDGTVNVSSADSEAVKKALEIIKSLTTEPEIGEVYEGTVKRIEPYGAFIEILPGKDGLCHISDIDWTHVQSVEEYVNLGDKVSVKVTNIDRDGRIRLSRKDAMPAPAGTVVADRVNGRPVDREERGGFRGGRDGERGGFRGRGRDGEREERPAFKPREEGEGRGPRDLGDRFRPREDREEKPAFKAREDRDEKPAFKAREERPAFKARDEELDEKPAFKAREEREEKPAFKAREEREEKPAFKAREEREEKPAFKAREDRPAFKARDEELDEKPAFKAREARPAFKARDEELDEKPAFKPREARPAFKARDEELDEKPAFKPREARPAFKARDEELDEKPAPKAREARPAFKARDEELDEKPAFKPREARPARVRDEERDEKPAFKAREDRPAFKARDDERDEKPAFKAREDRPAFKAREERPAFKARDEEPAFKAREDRPVREDRPARGRDDRFEREDRPARVRDEDVETPRPAARVRDREEDRFVPKAREDKPRARTEEDRFESRSERKPAREEDRFVPKAREDKPRARGEEDRFESRSERKPVRDEEPREERGFAKSRAEERPAPRSALRDEKPAFKARDDEPESVRPRERDEVRGRERGSRDERPAREERPALRSREERAPVRSERDEPRPAARRDEGDERPSRARRDEEPRRGRDDDRFERAREDVSERKPAKRTDDDRFEARPAVREPAVREPAVREPAVREDDDIEEGGAGLRDREDCTERERPSRTRARARTRERVREGERERERR